MFMKKAGTQYGGIGGVSLTVFDGGIAQVVFSCNVVVFFFVGAKERSTQAEAEVTMSFVFQAESTKSRTEQVFFLAFEINVKFVLIVESAVFGFTGFWYKIVIVLRKIAQKRELPFGCQAVRHVGLVVQKRRPVFCLSVEGT